MGWQWRKKHINVLDLCIHRSIYNHANTVDLAFCISKSTPFLLFLFMNKQKPQGKHL